jgi:hypothetical protein
LFKVLEAMFKLLQGEWDPKGSTALILGMSPMQVELNDTVNFQPALLNQISEVCICFPQRSVYYCTLNGRKIHT